MAKARAKGKRVEVELASDLKRLMGDASIKRNLAQADKGGCDLVGRSLRHVAIEVKSGEPPRWTEWIAQAHDQAGPGQVPVLVVWRARQPWLCLPMLELPQLAQAIKLLNAFKDGRQ